MAESLRPEAQSFDYDKTDTEEVARLKLLYPIATGASHCGERAWSPHGGGGVYSCTSQHGHTGMHVAHASYMPVAFWQLNQEAVPRG